MIELHESIPVRIPELRTGKPEITMAPLIDVVFLLLIFFMVTTIFPDNQGLIIERPAASSTESLHGKQLRFTVDKHGAIFHQNRRITTTSATQLVRQRLADIPDSTILLEVDRRTATEALIRIMDACKQGGAQQIGIVTDMSTPQSSVESR